MVKIFFITFFIAELIVAVWILSKIISFNRCVNQWNEAILGNKNKAIFVFEDLRLFFESFTNDLAKFKELIAQKRQDYFLKFLKTGLVYYAAFISKGKLRKTLIAYQLGKEIYEGLKEAEI